MAAFVNALAKGTFWKWMQELQREKALFNAKSQLHSNFFFLLPNAEGGFFLVWKRAFWPPTAFPNRHHIPLNI
jgi:hypothetical protein